MNYWKLVGHLLEQSGWTHFLVESGIAGEGRSEAYIHASHLKRTRHIHQVTAFALGKLQRDAFMTMKEEHEDFQEWSERMENQSPTFAFWKLIHDLELLGLTFVRAHREKNLDLYIQTLKEMAPLWFALDHPNYARWVPVHIADMENLSDSQKSDLHKGWTFSRSSRPFSAMPLDQAYEQNNAIVKGRGAWPVHRLLFTV